MDIVKAVLTQPCRAKALAALRVVNLTLKEAEILQSIYLDGLTAEETAERLYMSASNVSKIKQRAKQKCEKVFNEGGY
uniref:RNA polymerase sigma factor n=1 Tax=Phage sp. ctPjm15 TaxID=2828006 RepID=A0A8S5SQ73_9VIRU|nr:MAG TPA: RNA polymerase sigma factor [Phage sp. ctPjm15]